jgi:hypothetical protein
VVTSGYIGGTSVLLELEIMLELALLEDDERSG